MVNIVVPLVIGPYIMRLLDVDLYGLYNRVFADFQMFLAFASFGVYTLGVREISKIRNDKEKVSKLFTNLFVISFLSNMLVLIIYLIFSLITSTGLAKVLYLVMSIQIIANVFYVEFVNEALENYIHYGGLPYLIHLPMEEAIVSEYIKSIYSTIILKDVIQRKNIRNTSFLEQLILFLASNIGNLFSSKSISDFLKSQKVDISSYVVGEYAMALVDAFIIHQVRRFDIVGKRFFERGEKYYFEDLGIRNAIAGYKRQDRGARLENIVYNHLIHCGYEVKIGTLGTEEIDFVCQRNGEILYVQVALELSKQETIEREFGNLLKIKDNYPKVVVSGERSFENSYEGVEHVYFKDFLSSTLSHSILK